MFEFHAGYVHVDDAARRLSFADCNDPPGKHYFIMARLEESPEEAVPDMKNVYIVRDDQGWGGYGGIKTVILKRDNLTLGLTPRMATQMGGHDTIRVTFLIEDAEFRELQQVLGFVMFGYHSQLVVRPEQCGAVTPHTEFSVFQTPSAE